MTNDIRLWMYPGANPNSAASAWEPYYVDISSYIRRPGNDGGRPISYSWGKQDESTTTDAGQMTLTLDNRDGRFSTEKVDGPYYGSLDINTPIRLGVGILTDTFTRTGSGLGTANASLGYVWSAGVGVFPLSTNGSRAEVIMPNTNSFTIATLANADSRDVDVTATFTPLATATGGAYGGGTIVRYTDSSNYTFSTIEFNTDSTVTIKIRRTVLGVAVQQASLAPIPSVTYSANAAWKLRTQADGDQIRVKAWPASSTEPTSWQITATDQGDDGTGIGLYTVCYSGNTNSGSVALLAVDDYTAIGLEWTGFVVSWPLEWNITGNNSWAPITAAGILRRLRQGTNPVQSPLRHQLSGTANSVGYWPMEEGADATYFQGTHSSDIPGRFSQVTLAQDSTLAGGGSAPVLATDLGSIGVVASGNSGGTGFAAMVLFKLPSLPATKTRIVRVWMRSGPVQEYDLSVDVTGSYVDALDSTGASLGSAYNAFGEDFTTWIAWQLEVDNTLVSGKTAVSAIYHAVGKTAFFAQTFNVTGATPVSNVNAMTLTGPSGTAFAHAWLGQNTLPFNTNTFALVSSGYASEGALERFNRACGEAGIPYSTTVGAVDSESMGAQKESGTMAVLQSAIDTDYGVMIERGAGLEMIPRTVRYNATTLYTLSVAAGEIGAIPKPVRDDQRLRNKWTISGAGTSASYQSDSSVARNGTWEDSATINPVDGSNLPSQASWRVSIGTSTRLRWPSVPLNFARSPQLMLPWRKRTYGARWGITTGLTQVKGNEPDVIMEGYQASLDPDIWTVDMNCTDARTWQVGILDTNRLQAYYTTLGGSLTATATTLTFTISNIYEQWKPGPSTATVVIMGEEINLGTISAVSGSGPWTQTVTGCTRSVNGVSKTHAAGESVSVKNAIKLKL